MKLSASQQKEWDRYQRDARALQPPKPKKRRGGSSVNETLPLPKAGVRYISVSQHPKRGAELRCSICGAWYEDHRAGEFISASWDDGTRLVRDQAGGFDKGGGWRYRGPILWAMRVLKTQDFIAAHTAYHQGGEGMSWRHLEPWENVGPVGDLHNSNVLGVEQGVDPIWTRDPTAGVLTLGSKGWTDFDGRVWECDAERGDHCALTDIVDKAMSLGEVPF